MVLNIKELREKYGLSQQEFADKTGIPKGRINNWEQGKGHPKVEDYEKLKKWIDSVEIDLSQVNMGNTYQNTMNRSNKKDAAIEAAYQTVADGSTQYVLIPLKVLDKTQLVSIDEWAERVKELERKNGQIDFYQNQIAKLLENMELTPKPTNTKKSKE